MNEDIDFTYYESDSPFIPTFSNFLNLSDDFESKNKYEIFLLPDEEKTEINECMNFEDINNKNILKYTNLSEKTESSTEKNKEKIFECIKNKEKSFLKESRTNECTEKEKKDNSKKGLRKKKEKNLLGNKRKNGCAEKEEKQKIIRIDNILKKIKTTFLDLLLNLINNSLKESNINYILYKLNQKFIEDINVNFMNVLLYMQLKDIFSNDISDKGINKLGKDHNKKIIDKIIKDNVIKTKNILEKTFFECYEHFRGTKKSCEELNGLENKYKELIKGLKDKGKSEEYIETFKKVINTLEEEYKKKTPRNRIKNN